MGTIPEQDPVVSLDQRKIDAQDGMKKEIDRSRVVPFAQDIVAAIEWAHLGGD